MDLFKTMKDINLNNENIVITIVCSGIIEVFIEPIN